MKKINKTVLASKYGKIIINRCENGKTFVICDFNFKDDRKYFYRFDDEYTDNYGHRYSIKSFVKIPEKHRYKNKAKLVTKTFGTLMTDKIITDPSDRLKFYKFTGERIGVSFYVSIPREIIFPKEKKPAIKRLGNTMIHDKHGEACIITAVYRGGSFSHK